MIDDTAKLKEEVVIDFDSILQRAENSEKILKFTVSSTHYYTILSKIKDSIPENKFEGIKLSFIYNVFLLPSNQLKERMLNFILNGGVLEFSSSMLNILKKLYEKSIIYDEEASNFFSQAPTNISNLLLNEAALIEKATFEHNIHSLSLIYENINITTLSKFLKKSEETIKNLLFKMIIDGRIKGKIDENKNFLFFIKSDIQTFDVQIKNFCSKVQLLNESVSVK